MAAYMVDICSIDEQVDTVSVVSSDGLRLCGVSFVDGRCG